MAVAACLAPGCATAPPGLPSGVAIEVRQLRGDIAPGRVQLHVTNDSDAAITLDGLALDAAVLAEPGVWEDDALELAPGRAVNLPVPLPAVVCAADAAPVAVSGSIGGAGGDRRAFTTTASDPLAVLDGLGARQCDLDDIAAVADIRAVSVDAADGVAALGIAIHPVPTGEGSLGLTAVTGTPLLRFAGGEEAPLGLRIAAGDPPSVVAVDVAPRRCDPHALAEDKVGTILGLVVELDGREVQVPLPRDQDVADALLDFVGAACGLDG